MAGPRIRRISHRKWAFSTGPGGLIPCFLSSFVLHSPSPLFSPSFEAWCVVQGRDNSQFILLFGTVVFFKGGGGTWR